MKFVIDENIDIQITASLKQAEHEVWSILSEMPGVSDEAVLEFAKLHKAIIITEDKSFVDWIVLHRLINAGVILLRLLGIPSEEKAKILINALRKHGSEFNHNVTAITPIAIRIRRSVIPPTSS